MLHIEKYSRLVSALYRKTMDRQINWELDFGDEVFCRIGGSEIYLDSFRGSDGEPFESLEIRRNGQVIDKFNDGVLSSEDTGIPGTNYFGLMQDLRMAAKRKAMGADDAIDDILKGLE